jgi:hypothetical protein
MHPSAVAALCKYLPLPDRDSPSGTAVATVQARLVDRLIDVAGSLPDEYALPVLTVLAHTAWHQGNGALARVALDRARTADPCYFLAALLDRVVTVGMRPRAV